MSGGSGVVLGVPGSEQEIAVDSRMEDPLPPLPLGPPPDSDRNQGPEVPTATARPVAAAARPVAAAAAQPAAAAAQPAAAAARPPYRDLVRQVMEESIEEMFGRKPPRCKDERDNAFDHGRTFQGIEWGDFYSYQKKQDPVPEEAAGWPKELRGGREQGKLSKGYTDACGKQYRFWYQGRHWILSKQKDGTGVSGKRDLQKYLRGDEAGRILEETERWRETKRRAGIHNWYKQRVVEVETDFARTVLQVKECQSKMPDSGGPAHDLLREQSRLIAEQQELLVKVLRVAAMPIQTRFESTIDRVLSGRMAYNPECEEVEYAAGCHPDDPSA